MSNDEVTAGSIGFSLLELRRLAESIPRKTIVVPVGLKPTLEAALERSGAPWFPVVESELCAPNTAYIVDSKPSPIIQDDWSLSADYRMWREYGGPQGPQGAQGRESARRHGGY